MPTMPSRLPQMRWPSIQVGRPAGPVAVAGRAPRAPSASRRGTARISAMVMSAVSSVSTPGVLVTVMPRCSAVSTSMLSTPLPKLAISFSCSPGLGEHAAVDPVGDGRHQHVGDLDGLDQLGLAHRLVVEVQPRVEQLAHARLDAVRQLARDDHQRLLRRCHSLPLAQISARPGLRSAPATGVRRDDGAFAASAVQASLTALADTEPGGGTSSFSLADGCALTKRAGFRRGVGQSSRRGACRIAA